MNQLCFLDSNVVLVTTPYRIQISGTTYALITAEMGETVGLSSDPN
tara:strand:+ start:155 stop:292 length:138 start_codon:yes stop_codon:yes gene_type:complete